MKTISIIISALLLAGCATDGFLTNRVSCAVGGVHGFVNSMYGPVGLTSKVAQEDADVICARLKPAPVATPLESKK